MFVVRSKALPQAQIVPYSAVRRKLRLSRQLCALALLGL